MRLAQVLVPADTREDVLSALDELGIDHVVTDDDRPGTGGSVVFFPVPTGGVEAVFDRLHDQGLSRDAYTVLTKVESASPGRFQDIERRFGQGEGFNTLARTELRWKIREITWGRLIYHAGTFLSVVVAMAGLLVDSVALVVGAMVIAPQVSTAISASVGVVLADWSMFRDGVRRQVLGLGSAIVAVIAVAWLVRQTGVLSPLTQVTRIELMTGRLTPTILTTLGAFGAGAAGAFGFTTEQSSSLVGVMVAAAIVPAAAAVGIAVAWSLPLLALGAMVLLLVNLLAINVGSLLVLLGLGYGPDEPIDAWLPDRQEVVPAAMVVLLVVSLVGIGWLTAGQAQFQQGRNAAVQETLERPAYADLTLVRVYSDYAGPGATAVGTPDVTVTLSRTADRAYPDLADTLADRIERGTGTDVSVTTTFRESTTGR